MAESREVNEFSRLSKEIGSRKGLDPIPPSQYLTYMHKKYPPALRLWAWILSKTMRKGHRCAFCVDATGKPLTLKDAAAEMRMDESNIRRAWGVIEADCRARIDGGKLWLTAEPQISNAVLTEEEENEKVRTDLFPQYILMQLKRLPVNTRVKLENSVKRLFELKKDFAADLKSAAEDIIERKYNTLLDECRIERQTQTKKRENRSPFLPEVESMLEPIIEGRKKYESKKVRTDLKKVRTNPSERSVPTPASSTKHEETGGISRAEGIIEGFSCLPASSNAPDSSPQKEEAGRQATGPIPDDFREGLRARGMLPDSEEFTASVWAIIDFKCPLSHFFAQLDARRYRGKIGPGALSRYAADVVKKYAPITADSEAEQRKEALRAEEAQLRNERWAREILADANSDETERRFAREVLGETA